MNRRQFFKTLVATAAGVVAVGAAPRVVGAKSGGGENQPIGKFWMQTYGPWYIPTDANWEKADSTLHGIYSGKKIINLKASDCSIGEVLVLNDGKRYRCTALHENHYIEGYGLCSIDYYRKNDGIYCV